MAVISANTFDSLRRYVSVRLQQGVPIVDADWNELEDVRKFELQAFLKWFVGDGVSERNDGFRIDGTGLANDFVIRAGISGAPEGLSNVGRCLVNGLDVIITADLNFTAQPLHASQAGSAALAAALGVPQIQALTTPVANGTVVAYLDVWERLVTPVEDPSLVHAGLGTESCARIRREWVVRVRNGTSVPVSGDPDFVVGHSYYALATIARRTGIASINVSDVTDQRERRLLMPPATLIADLFGPVDYRRGQGRPPISFREVINAMLRGDVPGPPESAIAAAPGSDDNTGRGTFFDTTQGLITTWSSNRTGSNQIFGARLSLANPAAGFATPEQQITGGAVAHIRPHAVALDTGEMLVVYESATAPGNEDIHLKRGVLSSLTPASAEIAVANDALIRQRAPFVAVVGGQALIMWHESPSNTWQFNRFNLATNTFPNPKQQLSAITANAPGSSFELHAGRDSTNTVWVAFRTTTNNIHTLQVPAVGAPTVGEDQDPAAGPQDAAPFVLVDNSDNVWVFWNALGAGVAAIRYRQFVRVTSAWDPPLASAPALVTGTDVFLNVAPAAVADPDGGIWLFFHSNRSGSGNQDVWYIRRNPLTGIWGSPRQITGAPEADTNPFVLRGTDGVLWLFWNRQLGANGELFFRRIITSI